MTEQFFHGCFTEQEVKARYRNLCKMYHPDLGGSEEMMKALNLAYEARLRQKFQQNLHPDDVESAVDLERELAAKVAEIIALQGIIVELVGRWIWVTGETYSVRQALKVAGFWFASKKRAWYWHMPEDTCPNKKAKDLEEIRQKYGSKVLSSKCSYIG